SRRAEIKGVNVMRFPSAESKLSWGRVARCCFELPSLTGDRQIPIVFGGPWVSCPGGPIFPLLHASSRTKDVSGPARAGSNCLLSTTDAVGEPDAGSLHRSNHWLEPETCDEWHASLLNEAEHQTHQCPADHG